VDVVAETGLIERGTKIKVVAVEGARIVVRAT
jgi:membrane-bound ClpP family serine protease